MDLGNVNLNMLAMPESGVSSFVKPIPTATMPQQPQEDKPLVTVTVPKETEIKPDATIIPVKPVSVQKKGDDEINEDDESSESGEDDYPTDAEAGKPGRPRENRGKRKSSSMKKNAASPSERFTKEEAVMAYHALCQTLREIDTAIELPEMSLISHGNMLIKKKGILVEALDDIKRLCRQHKVSLQSISMDELELRALKWDNKDVIVEGKRARRTVALEGYQSEPDTDSEFDSDEEEEEEESEDDESDFQPSDAE
ncbi:hypothetical protein J8273_4806 [Carpediemonas membranifera]|uniref:Uncharacterized protein n=1 Tax=Carpediemonas membranifera TaxID=201153 RepID=A0A8J6BB55_9EUKA|nr:hypothetical protein J8273_4806 [Carpediemonas membranifera]|eukprot:KAG9393687.1 hypothetical protein J8273_4806 [Carpediemonas membranifera]